MVTASLAVLSRRILPVFWACLWSVSGLLAAVTLAQDCLQVEVLSEEISFFWSVNGEGELSIRELPIETGSESSGRIVWRGKASAGGAKIGRIENGKDRLFSGYQLVSEDGRQALGRPQYVTGFDSLPRRNGSLGSRASKKGIACLLDSRDGTELGFNQANQNINIGALLDLSGEKPRLSFEYEGREVGLNPEAVARLDKDLLEAHAAARRVTGILLNYVRADTPRSNPLLHPMTDPAVVPIGPSAFNTATEDGVFYFRAVLNWLLERYTREDAAFGHLGGLVIGNEMQSHWSWYHLGRVDSAVVIREYSAALRVADLVSRSWHVDFPIYVSLDHHWALSASEDPEKGFSGLEAMEGINETCLRGGNFPWNVAFHPYPENLLDARFWLDRSAPLRLDAPRITFHNIEVLGAFLRQDRFLYGGRERRIALTEQGFHCGDGPSGEIQQAAAYALAWKKVTAIPEVESFLYHRHVDHPQEHGLRCGIREHDGTANVNGVGRRRRLWDTVKSAGTPEEDAAFAFALPVVGLRDWSAVVAGDIAPGKKARRREGKVVYDFVRKFKDAGVENVASVERRKIGAPDEVPEQALQEHPNPRGIGMLRFKVSVPGQSPEDQRVPWLVFEALLNNDKSTGAGFVVEVDGQNVFSKVLAGGERVPAEINLRDWSGREVAFGFGVDAEGDPSYDWATWVAPALVLR